MNTVKKIIALITVVLIVVRLAVISVSASFSAPLVAEETLKLLFIEALGASGSTNSYDDFDAWELDDLQNEFKIQMKTNPNFKPKNSIPFLVSPNLEDIPGTPEHQEKVQGDIIKLRKQTDKAVADWIDNMIEKGGEIYDFINPTYTVDLKGGTSVLYYYWAGKDDKRYYDVYYSSQPAELYYSYGRLSYFIRYDYKESYSPNGVRIDDRSSTLTGELDDRHFRYGQWVWSDDGTEAETDDEGIPVIGEADGTQVTPDMLNPDGTVTIGDTTYSPSDYIDWDKFKDPAITDLLERILNAIESMPVVDDTQLDLDIDTDVTLPSELSDFSISGFINVFPFCLPYDFIRGMRLFSAEAEVPHFEKEITIPAFLNVPEQKWKFEIDFKELEPLAKITRWTSLISFVYGLILLTPKIAKGA